MLALGSSACTIIAMPARWSEAAHAVQKVSASKIVVVLQPSMFGASGASQPASAFGASQPGFAFGQQNAAPTPAFGGGAPPPTFGGGAFGPPATAFSAGTSNTGGPVSRRKVAVRRKK